MQSGESAVNKGRIAKNTLMLYVRMLFVMAISLYTSRVVLEALGVEDFGIYSVVGGVVSLFVFVNSAMSVGTQRFITYAVGRGDQQEVAKIFSSSLSIHMLIALVVFVLAQSVGLWLLNHKLNIPEERMFAANWVYQFSVLTTMINITQVPYTASIIAQERMNIYAFVSIFDGAARLIMAYLILVLGYDKLILYGFLYLLISMVVAMIYRLYAVRNFSYARYKFYYDKAMWRELGEYAVWNIFGNLAAVSFMQGVNVLLNIFFGPVVNSARAISMQVNGAMVQFVTSFQTAMNPQIVKSYARERVTEMMDLVFRGSRFSFLLLWIISTPLLVNMKYLLELWLVEVPPQTVIFTQIVIFNSLIDSLSGTLMVAMQSTGRIKLYQSFVGGILLMNLPICYLFLRAGYHAEVVYYVLIGCSVVALFARLWVVKRYLPLSFIGYFRSVIAPVSVLMFLSYWALRSGIFESDNFWGVFQSGVIVAILCVVASGVIGVTNIERVWLWGYIERTIKKVRGI